MCVRESEGEIAMSRTLPHPCKSACIIIELAYCISLSVCVTIGNHLLRMTDINNTVLYTRRDESQPHSEGLDPPIHMAAAEKDTLSFSYYESNRHD